MRSRSGWHPTLQNPYWAGIQLFAVYFFVRAASSFLLPETAWIFPGSAVALVLLYFSGPRLWPFLMASCVAVELFIAHGITSMFIAAGSFSVAFAGSTLLRTWKIDPIFRRKRDTYVLLRTVALASFLMPAAALIMSLSWKSPVTMQFLIQLYIGTVLTTLFVTPFLLRLIVKPRFSRTQSELFELLTVFAVLLFCSYFVLRGNDIVFYGIPLGYVVLAPLFWIALRMRPRFITFALMVVSIFALEGMIRTGTIDMPIPFIHAELRLILIAVIFLFISTQEEERRASENFSLSQMQTLENALVRIKNESSSKQNFIAVLAHELRNPLAPVVSTIEYLKLRGGRDAAENEALEVIEDRMGTIRRILDDLLDVSSIREGKPVFDLQTMELKSAIHASILSTHHYRAERHQELIVDMKDDAYWIDGDKVRVEQIFTNLLSNASKYSNSGDIISMRASIEGKNVSVSISDTGVGLSPDTMGQIFLPFQQIHNPKKRVEGLGIGLALVKSFVEVHNGTVRVESAGINRGTTFVISLPLAPTPAARMPSQPQPTISHQSLQNSGKLILIADDNDAAAASLGKLLGAMKYRISYAYDGAQAVNIALANMPDVIILDLNMPGKNGLVVATELRERGYKGKIGALSGYDEASAKEMYGNTAVFDKFLVKPIGLSDIKNFIEAA